MGYRLQYVIALLVLIALLVGGFALLNRPHFVPIREDIPTDFPAVGFSHTYFETLLQTYVDADGNVDYESWHDSEAAMTLLHSYLAAVSRFSPEHTPERFPSSDDELAYWL